MPRSPKNSPRKPAKKTKAKTERAADSDLERDFEPAIWNKAAKLAGTYTYLSRYDAEEECYFGRTLELPLVMADGQSPEACLRETLEATTVAVASLLEDGERPPQAVSEQKRTAQLNVRLTADEKLRLEEAARSAGFRGVSEFVRTAALNQAG
ncbi:MAG: type II toxin-antitoxin system HicB family antitoxin [Planctomycetota bacterium]